MMHLQRAQYINYMGYIQSGIAVHGEKLRGVEQW